MFKIKKNYDIKRTYNTILKSPIFRVVEAYKMLRTNMLFSVPAVDGRAKRFMFTSATPGDGKSTTSVNTAITFAQQTDIKVLLIDADLRKATNHKYFDMPSKMGLSNVLSGQNTIEECIQKVFGVPNLDLMASGVLPPNPAELLSGNRMNELFAKLDTMYDVIIIDTPPVNVVTDALNLCRFADGVVVVASQNKTTYPEIQDAVKQLKIADARIIGVVLNRAKSDKSKRKQVYSNYYRNDTEE